MFQTQNLRSSGSDMGNITKEDLHAVVFVAAHNSGGLNEETQHGIDGFDPKTYRRFLRVALERREHADRTGDVGGGTRSASYLNEAIDNLDFILSQ